MKALMWLIPNHRFERTQRGENNNLDEKVLILGANGNITRQVIDILVKRDDIILTLFLRNKNRLRNKDLSRCSIIEGNVMDYDIQNGIKNE